MKKICLLILLIISTITICAQKKFVLTSPDGVLKAHISVGKEIAYSVLHGCDTVLSKSAIAMQLDKGRTFGVESRLSAHREKTVRQYLKSPFYKKKEIEDYYNLISLRFKDGFHLEFRAYNEGIAYRFVSMLREPFLVENEIATFNLVKDRKAFIPYVRKNVKTIEEQFYNTFENVYTYQAISEWKHGQLSMMPLAIELDNGKKVCITEADLEDYPGMYLFCSTPKTKIELNGVYAPCPKIEKQGGHINSQMVVLERESYIAKCDGKREFPWRVLVVSTEDRELANNDMVYKLASPSRVNDISWIKPGKVAWEWWNDLNLYGVDFKTGINNDTYKYYIDFASRFGIEYVILDEGWSKSRQADLFQVVPDINLEELVEYAKEKNVGIILWAGYYAFARDMEKVCKHYSAMGIKGFKIDFMDRDDQKMVDFHYKAAELTAKYNLLVDFHGSYKPTGLNRTYPNVINFEGVHGLEQQKFADSSIDQVTYDVTIPFIRQLAGPMDYTQGAMRNATKENFSPIYSEPMSQGTRCRQLAQYVVFESPLNMLCDSPSNYIDEEECTKFIAIVPTVWDVTHSLVGEIGKYIAIARKSGDDWYVGAMTNWDRRSLEIDFSFLEEGLYEAEIFQDGINAHRVAKDYRRKILDIKPDKKLSFELAPGGGFAMHIKRKW